jgi:hypothetical protein
MDVLLINKHLRHPCRISPAQLSQQLRLSLARKELTATVCKTISRRKLGPQFGKFSSGHNEAVSRVAFRCGGRPDQRDASHVRHVELKYAPHFEIGVRS